MSTTTDLVIGGMTCASCATRVEKKLNKLDGVAATVNLATETARVSFPDALTVADLIAAVERTGYTAALPAAGTGTGTDADAGQGKAGSPRRRLVVSLALAVPVIVLAMVPAARFPAWQWVSLVLATPVATWGAWPFHRAAAVNARHGAATMDTLVSVGVAAAYCWSVYALVFGGATYLEVAVSVTALILLGRYLELRARRQAGTALKALLDLGAKQATVLRDGREVTVAADALMAGDEFVVRPGEKIATDGVVVTGRSAVDTSMLTGEPVPAEAGPGEVVTGGCVNVGGRLIVRATRVGADTQLAQMARLVTQAQAGKAQVQRLADRVSAVFVPVVFAIAAATLVGWLVAGGPAASAFTAAVAVLIIACPCAMGLATPTAILVGTGRGAQLGILIKGPEALENTRRVDTVVFDKTGTVTTGRMTLTGVVTVPGLDERELLRYAGAVESASEHPIAAAITSGARHSVAQADGCDNVPPLTGPVPQPSVDHASPLPDISDFSAQAGQGVSAVVTGHAVLVGQRAWLAGEWALTIPAALARAADEAEEKGQTTTFVALDGAVGGVLIVADTIKPTSPAAIRQLRAMGLHPVLLTGDNERAARAVAAEVGIDDVIAGVLPGGKLDAIKRLQDEGRTVAMVGDGVNDAAALAQADLGLAMGTGTDAAIEAADLTLVSGDLRAVPDAIGLSRKTLATIKGNLAWAFGYNVAAIPLAASGLLNPMIAAAAMAFSSVFVVTNSLRLRGFARTRLAPPRQPGQSQADQREDHDRDHPADGVAVTVVAEQAAEHDRGDTEGDDDARHRQAAPGPHGVRAERGVRHRPGGWRNERRALARQVGEQPGEVGPGSRLKRAPGPVVELVLREPSGLEVLAQLGDRLIALGVRHAHAAAREAPGFSVHGRCPSLLAPWPKCWL
jgi:Cu+-exporting ATPase